MIDERYGENYYKSGNYTDYLQRKDRYVKLGESVIELLNKMNLANGPILDFGCATGFLMEGLQDLEFAVEGVEVSEWAIEQCRQKDLDVSSVPNYNRKYGITFALDVLEHLNEEELDRFVSNIQSDVLVFRMPIVREGDDDYYLAVARRDPTHLIRWTKQQWVDFFIAKGYLPIDLNLPSIYCTVGGYSGFAIKL